MNETAFTWNTERPWQVGHWATLKRNPLIRGHIIAMWRDWAWLFDPHGSIVKRMHTCALDGLAPMLALPPAIVDKPASDAWP